MEPVLFYGVPHGCSFGSIVAFEWLNEPYRLCRIDMLNSRQDVFVRVNPVRETPALLLPDGEALSESLAILQHVAARGMDKKLGFRQGTREFDRLNYVLAFLVAGFHPAWGPIFQPAKYAGDAAASQEAVRSQAIARAAKGYQRIETMLTGKQWLVGNGPTIADAYLYGVARWGEDLGVFDTKRDYPRLHDFRQKLAADNAVIFAHAIEDEKPARTSGKFLGHVPLEEVEVRLAA